MTQRVLRLPISVDDQDHEVNVVGTIVHVGPKDDPAFVHVWSISTDSEGDIYPRTFQVFATGQEIPDNYKYIGTANYVNYRLVWHLFEKVS